jgi:hypothetical protein
MAESLSASLEALDGHDELPAVERASASIDARRGREAAVRTRAAQAPFWRGL